jgi:hypothetical protein
MAANGLAVGLLAFAGHGRREPQIVVEARAEQPASSLALFAVERLWPAADAETDLFDIHRAYLGWCRAERQEPIPERVFGQALADLFETSGIAVTERDGAFRALGVEIKTPALRIAASGGRKALGAMHRTKSSAA